MLNDNTSKSLDNKLRNRPFLWMWNYTGNTSVNYCCFPFLSLALLKSILMASINVRQNCCIKWPTTQGLHSTDLPMSNE